MNKPNGTAHRTLVSDEVQRMLRPPADDTDAIFMAQQRRQARPVDVVELLGAQTDRHHNNDGLPPRFALRTFVDNILYVNATVLRNVHVQTVQLDVFCRRLPDSLSGSNA